MKLFWIKYSVNPKTVKKGPKRNKNQIIGETKRK